MTWLGVNNASSGAALDGMRFDVVLVMLAVAGGRVGVILEAG